MPLENSNHNVSNVTDSNVSNISSDTQSQCQKIVDDVLLQIQSLSHRVSSHISTSAVSSSFSTSSLSSFSSSISLRDLLVGGSTAATVLFTTASVAYPIYRQMAKKNYLKDHVLPSVRGGGDLSIGSGGGGDGVFCHHESNNTEQTNSVGESHSHDAAACCNGSCDHRSKSCNKENNREVHASGGGGEGVGSCLPHTIEGILDRYEDGVIRDGERIRRAVQKMQAGRSSREDDVKAFVRNEDEDGCHNRSQEKYELLCAILLIENRQQPLNSENDNNADHDDEANYSDSISSMRDLLVSIPLLLDVLSLALSAEVMDVHSRQSSNSTDVGDISSSSHQRLGGMADRKRMSPLSPSQQRLRDRLLLTQRLVLLIEKALCRLVSMQLLFIASGAAQACDDDEYYYSRWRQHPSAEATSSSSSPRAGSNSQTTTTAAPPACIYTRILNQMLIQTNASPSRQEAIDLLCRFVQLFVTTTCGGGDDDGATAENTSRSIVSRMLVDDDMLFLVTEEKDSKTEAPDHPEKSSGHKEESFGHSLHSIAFKMCRSLIINEASGTKRNLQTSSASSSASSSLFTFVTYTTLCEPIFVRFRNLFPSHLFDNATKCSSEKFSSNKEESYSISSLFHDAKLRASLLNGVIFSVLQPQDNLGEVNKGETSSNSFPYLDSFADSFTQFTRPSISLLQSLHREQCKREVVGRLWGNYTGIRGPSERVVVKVPIVSTNGSENESSPRRFVCLSVEKKGRRVVRPAYRVKRVQVLACCAVAITTLDTLLSALMAAESFGSAMSYGGGWLFPERLSAVAAPHGKGQKIEAAEFSSTSSPSLFTCAAAATTAVSPISSLFGWFRRKTSSTLSSLLGTTLTLSFAKVMLLYSHNYILNQLLVAEISAEIRYQKRMGYAQLSSAFIRNVESGRGSVPWHHLVVEPSTAIVVKIEEEEATPARGRLSHSSSSSFSSELTKPQKEESGLTSHQTKDDHSVKQNQDIGIAVAAAVNNLNTVAFRDTAMCSKECDLATAIAISMRSSNNRSVGMGEELALLNWKAVDNTAAFIRPHHRSIMPNRHVKLGGASFALQSYTYQRAVFSTTASSSPSQSSRSPLVAAPSTSGGSSYNLFSLADAGASSGGKLGAIEEHIGNVASVLSFFLGLAIVIALNARDSYVHCCCSYSTNETPPLTSPKFRFPHSLLPFAMNTAATTGVVAVIGACRLLATEPVFINVITEKCVPFFNKLVMRTDVDLMFSRLFLPSSEATITLPAKEQQGETVFVSIPSPLPHPSPCQTSLRCAILQSMRSSLTFVGLSEWASNTVQQLAEFSGRTMNATILWTLTGYRGEEEVLTAAQQRGKRFLSETEMRNGEESNNREETFVFDRKKGTLIPITNTDNQMRKSGNGTAVFFGSHETGGIGGPKKGTIGSFDPQQPKSKAHVPRRETDPKRAQEINSVRKCNACNRFPKLTQHSQAIFSSETLPPRLFTTGSILTDFHTVVANGVCASGNQTCTTPFFGLSLLSAVLCENDNVRQLETRIQHPILSLISAVHSSAGSTTRLLICQQSTFSHASKTTGETGAGSVWFAKCCIVTRWYTRIGQHLTGGNVGTDYDFYQAPASVDCLRLILRLVTKQRQLIHHLREESRYCLCSPPSWSVDDKAVSVSSEFPPEAKVSKEQTSVENRNSERANHEDETRVTQGFVETLMGEYLDAEELDVLKPTSADGHSQNLATSPTTPTSQRFLSSLAIEYNVLLYNPKHFLTARILGIEAYLVMRGVMSRHHAEDEDDNKVTVGALPKSWKEVTSRLIAVFLSNAILTRNKVEDAIRVGFFIFSACTTAGMIVIGSKMLISATGANPAGTMSSNLKQLVVAAMFCSKLFRTVSHIPYSSLFLHHHREKRESGDCRLSLVTASLFGDVWSQAVESVAVSAKSFESTFALQLLANSPRDGEVWKLQGAGLITNAKGPKTMSFIRNAAGKICSGFSLRDGIEFRNVSFHYPNAENGSGGEDSTRSQCDLATDRTQQWKPRTQAKKMALDNFSAFFEANKMIGVIGPSGCGKSTLVSLLLRAFDASPTCDFGRNYHPSSSSGIFLDGVPIEEFDVSYLRSLMVVIDQNTQLVAGATFAEQIAMFASISATTRTEQERPCVGHKVSLRDVIIAAKLANCHDFIMKRPGGYNHVPIQSQTGDCIPNGASSDSLSSGEKQRIVLARSLLQLQIASPQSSTFGTGESSRIIILDEATNRLDATNESHFTQALLTLRRNGTPEEPSQHTMHQQSNLTFINITHRMSSLKGCDYVVMMKDGTCCGVEGGDTSETKSNAAVSNRNTNLLQRYCQLQSLK